MPLQERFAAWHLLPEAKSREGGQSCARQSFHIPSVSVIVIRFAFGGLRGCRSVKSTDQIPPAALAVFGIFFTDETLGLLRQSRPPPTVSRAPWRSCALKHRSLPEFPRDSLGLKASSPH